MTDIAGRLRDMVALAGAQCDPEFNRALLGAAAEIERLKRRVSETSDLLDRADENLVKHEQEIERQRAENESLRGQLLGQLADIVGSARNTDAMLRETSTRLTKLEGGE